MPLELVFDTLPGVPWTQRLATYISKKQADFQGTFWGSNKTTRATSYGFCLKTVKYPNKRCEKSGKFIQPKTWVCLVMFKATWAALLFFGGDGSVNFCWCS